MADSNKPNTEAINELQHKKLEARNKLRALRSEMKAYDIELIKHGASREDLQLACW
ncbi:hypothetical protein ACVME8_010605 [Bradyrhizobium diazoefficiens]